MKRFIAIISAFLLLIAMLSGCNQTDKREGADLDDKISVVATIFPQYDWVRQILGDKADNLELTLLLDRGVDLHSYQPTADDIIKISTCDLFIYVGGESDEWVEDVLAEAVNPDMVTINLLDELGDAAKEEEIVEGMEEDHNEEISEILDHDSHEEEIEYDEHVWLSLKNAETLCTVITDALSSLDTDNAEAYQSNLTAYTKKLTVLDAEYRMTVDTASVKTLLFGDRFPFRYLADDYGLSYYAAFPGCSAETEASFETIIFLAGKVDELGLNSVIVTESADQSVAKTIINNSTSKNQQILVLDSMQSVTAGNVKSGTTYLSIMEGNLKVLTEALK